MSVKKILSLKKYCFLKQSIDSSISLTPLSQQIKQNIANEWIKCNRRLPSIAVFANPLISTSNPIPRSQIDSTETILDNYNNYYRLWGEKSRQTIGVIQKLICIEDNNSKNILNVDKSDGLLLSLFCPKNQSLLLFQKLQGFHRHWFRNLSKSPLRCKVWTESKADTTVWSLNNTIDGNNLNIEEISCYYDSTVEQKFGITDREVITCYLDLDNSLVSLLCDAFVSKSSQNQMTVKKMKINESIAPYKIAFTFRDNNNLNEKMIKMTEYLMKVSETFEIPILPFTQNNGISIESCDELGIPYIVIVDEESPKNGVISLRNRDTETEETIHISNYSKTICLYLNIIHPSKVNQTFNV